MKFMWRVTKYNPTFRDENGTYIKDEWTSFSDIGKKVSRKGIYTR